MSPEEGIDDFTFDKSAPYPHPTKKLSGEAELNAFRINGRDRDRTDDLYRVKVALIPTELRARETSQNIKLGDKSVNPCQPSFSKEALLSRMSVMMNDVATDQLPDHGADQNIGREVIETANTRQADGCCESVRAYNNKRFVVVLAGHHGCKGERTCCVT